MRRSPFQIRISHFETPKAACELPFAIGGATQNHWDAAESQNSQDALAIIVNTKVIVGVVTDGCTGTHPKLENSCNSSNEVGAKLLAFLVSRAALSMATTQGDPLSADAFVESLSKTVQRKLLTMLDLFAESDAADREMFALDFLMATILGFVVTETQFIIFHCGDGIIGLNGKIHVLDSEAGTYLASDLIIPLTEQNRADLAKRHSLKPFASGSTIDLESVFLATDGLSRLVGEHPNALASFINTSPPSQQTTNGFDFLLQEFRQKLAWNPDVTIPIDDDATFALLRRHGMETTSHDHS
jgi:hypothetical protein